MVAECGRSLDCPYGGVRVTVGLVGLSLFVVCTISSCLRRVLSLGRNLTATSASLGSLWRSSLRSWCLFVVLKVLSDLLTISYLGCVSSVCVKLRCRCLCSGRIPV